MSNRGPAVYVISVVGAFVAGALLAGAWLSRAPGHAAAGPGTRQILYYHDPMHPSYRSDKPGVAPDCGMALEPVYADSSPSQQAPPAAGTVLISPEKQQAIGVRLEEVANSASIASLPIRVPGRVVADETRVFRVSAPTDGRIVELTKVTTGTLVAKDETLAVYSNLEMLTAQRAFLFALIAMDRYQSSGQETQAQIDQAKNSIQQSRLTLRNLGMYEGQIDEIAKTRQSTENIRIVSPASGVVTTRAVFPGQKFERGTEFFRIADLSRLWVVADVYESESRLIPGIGGATIRYNSESIPAALSKAVPQFDPQTRVMKVRFEVDNPGLLLRPDMFVNVELKVNRPAALTIPADAALDSGLHKTVFVDRGNGYFEPRRIVTGTRYGDRVAVTSGLSPGERIVVAGNFLLDSESRLRLNAAQPQSAAKDNVCGMDIDPAAPTARHAIHQGKTYFFCSETCRRSFMQNPARYTAATAPPPA